MITWNITPEESWGALAQAQVDAIEADLVRLVDSLTDDAAAWMKREARWQDRTGEARAGLYSDILVVARESVFLLLSHGPAIGYSQWLEYAYGGRFGILDDATDHFWPILYRGAVEIVRKNSG